MPTDILFLDLSNDESPPTPLSLHTWKVRLALNIKNLNYTTQWISYLSIAPTLKSLGIAPTSVHPDGSPYYTVPAIIDRTDPDNHVRVSDSTPIIEYLEKAYPTPGINLAPEPAIPLLHHLDKVIVRDLFMAMNVDLFLTGVYDRAQPEQKKIIGMVLETRFGCPVDKIEKRGEEREEAWKRLEKSLGFIAEAYDKSSGLFIVPGTSPTLADVRLAAWMVWARFMRPGEAWSRLSEWHGGRWVRFFEYFEKFLLVDGRTITLS